MRPFAWLIGFFVTIRIFSAAAQPLTSTQIENVVERTLAAFEVPGIAVGIIKDGQLVHAKGYGVRSLKTKVRMDENTLFGVASNSKAFTTAALGMLADEGKLKWDDLVIDYIPEFRLYDPYVTSVFTIRDLVTHRSGLGLGAGDLMFWPDSSDFTVKDIIQNLRHLKPVSGFRTKYDYDNLMYIVAGEIVARVSGISWEEFIETRIMKPLQMNSSAASYERLRDKSNVIDPHAPLDGRINVIKRDWSATANAAGGIYTNIVDLSKWLIMHMDEGKYGQGLHQRLISEKNHDEMWTPQTIIPVKERTRSVAAKTYNTHFYSYGLGWFISDVKGYKQVGHSGGLAGTVTLVTLIPELKLGIIVLTNQQSGAAFNAVTNSIKDGYLGIKGNDWVKIYQDIVAKDKAEAEQILAEVRKKVDASQRAIHAELRDSVLGSYIDPWFGAVVVEKKGAGMILRSKRSPRLTGELLHYKGNTFVVKWKDRSFDADAFVMFQQDGEGAISGMKMVAISPLTDFSFDFHDLDFVKLR
jgi:CubicO group peptidase (beta-lactamase class C family)